jgi:HPt (histidine-containing phosphotransfer) domain-containing protein
MLAALRKAREAGQADAYRRAAHSLKSNSLTFGATALAAQARAIELGGMSADAAQDQAAIDALAAAYAEAARALEGLIDA